MNGGLSGFLVILFYVLMLFGSIGLGVLSWNIVEPESFGGGIIFFVLWMILGKIAHLVLTVLLTAIGAMLD